MRATEYYSALKKVEGLAACNGWMNLEAVMPREVGHRRRRKAARRSSNEDRKRPNPGAREYWVPEAVGGGWGVSLGGHTVSATGQGRSERAELPAGSSLPLTPKPTLCVLPTIYNKGKRLLVTDE